MSTVLETASALEGVHDRHAFNLAIWDRLVDDPSLAAIFPRATLINSA
jgi:hypothetical protein